MQKLTGDQFFQFLRAEQERQTEVARAKQMELRLMLMQYSDHSLSSSSSNATFYVQLEGAINSVQIPDWLQLSE